MAIIGSGSLLKQQALPSTQCVQQAEVKAEAAKEESWQR